MTCSINFACKLDLKQTPLIVSFPESPTVMLAAGSFSSPYEHLSQPETKRMVEHYTAYLSDNTRLIANPGLKVHKHTSLETSMQLVAKKKTAWWDTHSNAGVHVIYIYLTNMWHAASPVVRLHTCTQIFPHANMYKHY